MLPLIFRVKTGIIFLVFVVLLLISELYSLIRYKKVVKKSISYNSFLIFTTMYILLIYYRIYSIDGINYITDYTYLKFNYLLFSLALVFILIDLYIGISEYKKCMVYQERGNKG